MKVPKRLLVLQRLVALLEVPMDIMQDGNETVMTDSVLRGRLILGDEDLAVDLLPVISIIENPRPDIALFAGLDLEARSEQWTLLIQGIVEENQLSPGEPAYWLHAAVEERLSWITQVKDSGTPKYPEHYLLGNLITGLEISPPVVRPADSRASSARAFFFLPVRVGMGDVTWRPYTEVP